MKETIFLSLLLGVIFSWEEVKGLCFKFMRLLSKTKPKHIQKKYLDQFVADAAFVATIPIGLVIIFLSSQNLTHSLAMLSIELFLIFIFIEIAKFVSRHTPLLTVGGFQNLAGVLSAVMHSPFPLARFYKFKFDFGSKIILDFFFVAVLIFAGTVAVKNLAPESLQGNLIFLVLILAALVSAMVVTRHLHPLLHKSRHPFWTNFRLLAGIIVSAMFLIK